MKSEKNSNLFQSAVIERS